MTTIYYQMLDSTNTHAKRLLDQGLSNNTLIVATRQSEGRGRMGRQFYSPLGGIYMSLVLVDPPKEPGLVTAAAAVGAAQAIEEVYGISCGIKWVNDLFYGEKKVCGILTELYRGCLVIGIGINDYPPPEGYPTELQDIVGSLGTSPGRRHRLIPTIADWVSAMVRVLPKEDFLDEYRRRSNVLGKAVTLRRGEEVFDGIAVAIDDQCRLLCRLENGETMAFTTGEVSIRLSSIPAQ